MIKHLRTKCEELANECEDFNDCMTYLPELVSDFQDDYPSMVDSDIMDEAVKILKELYNEPQEEKTETFDP